MLQGAAKRVRQMWLDLRVQTRAKWKLTGWTVAYALQLALLGTGLMLLLHGYNLYPGYKAAHTRRQQDGQVTWEHVCGEGSRAEAVASRHVNCEAAFKDSRISPSLHAIESVIHHLLGDLNLFKYLVPSSSGVLGYVLLRTLDVVLGYSTMLFGVAIVLSLWYAYTFYVGPYQAYRDYRLLSLGGAHGARRMTLEEMAEADMGYGQKRIRVNANTSSEHAE